MSIWTSRVGRALAVCLALSACVEGAAVGSGGAPRSMAVAGGAVIVSGPTGYCIDRRESRDGKTAAFVLFGTCAALSGSSAAAQPAEPAVLTASVLPAAASSADQAQTLTAMAAFLRSVPGRAALSRSGDANAVEIAQMSSVGDVLFVRLRDRSRSAGAEVEPEYWRAVLLLRGRIVTLSAMALSEKPMSAAAKRKVLDAFVKRMRSVNAGAAAAA